MESTEIRIGSSDLEDRTYTQGSDATTSRTRATVEDVLPTEPTEASIGFEGMMNDITELIEVMPLENAVEEVRPSILPSVMLHLQRKPPVVTMPYDPSERPTSRWR